jgi:hypothetical protein
MNKQMIDRTTARCDRNDAAEMLSLEEMRIAGLKPSQRVLIGMSAEGMPSLGNMEWNRKANLSALNTDEE